MRVAEVVGLSVVSVLAAVVAVFAVVMFCGWRRSVRALAEAQGPQNRRRRGRVRDPQIDEDRHVQGIRRRMQERT